MDHPNWRPRSRLSSELKLHISGSVFPVDMDLLAAKSAKISKLLQKSSIEDLSPFLRDIPADEESLEIVSKFCHGFEINFSTENVVRVACVAHYLGMTDTHFPNNLLSRAFLYFQKQVIPSWNNSIKALKSAENLLQQALHIGLIDHCVESVISKVQDEPRLLGEPVKIFGSDSESDENEKAYKPNARRKLFDLDWKSEDLTALSLHIYVPIIQEMMSCCKVPPEYIAANLSQYLKKWIFEKGVQVYKRTSQRETVEAIEKLLPHNKGVSSSTFLSEMLRYAMVLDADDGCKHGLEMRIGRQLDQASIEDLLIPSLEYSKDEKYDTEFVRRVLKIYYANYTSPDTFGLNKTAELIDGFLAEVSADKDLSINTFLAFAEMSVAASRGTHRASDGLYKAIHIYLKNHKDLSESEKEKLCCILDCNQLSSEAREHAAMNSRLPLRIVMRVLFVGQLKLRDAIGNESRRSDLRLMKLDDDVEGGSGARVSCAGEEEVKAEIVRMGSKVIELERECHIMRGEIQKKKRSVWSDLKQSFGCGTTSFHDHDCYVAKKKVHPK